MTKKRITPYIYSIVLCAIMSFAPHMAKGQTWDFTSVTDADKTALSADTENWYDDTSKGRYNSQKALETAPLTANGTEISFAKGLKFTAGAASSNTNGKIRVNYKDGRLGINGVATITIPSLKAGQTVKVKCKTSSKSTARGFNVTNLSPKSGYFNTTTTDTQENEGTVEADGEVTLTSTGGLYVYYISAGSGSDSGSDSGSSGSDDGHSAKLNLTQPQARLIATDGTVAYYNTANLAGIDFDKTSGTVTVKEQSGEWQDAYTSTISNITFARPTDTEPSGSISNNGVQITEAKGWNEAVCVKWNLLDGADNYNVYVKGGQYADYTLADKELVRNYGTYARADVPGLKAGSYSVKVVPVSGGAELSDKASTAEGLDVRAYDRSGFAHHNYQGVGAYNDDGTLKTDARVIYVTKATAKTVSLPVLNGKTETTLTGLQAIINGYQKGLETRPLDVRIIGTVSADDMDYFGSKAEGLQVKGKNNNVSMNITIEGIGDDAAIHGFGLLLRNALSVELRNFAIMMCMDDAVSLDTDNKNCWIHHLDLFYGKTGGDSDQAKGDGTIDVKSDSRYITIAYNHFFDCGKTSLCGMTSESGPNYIDYHHNWFDHSDSRHPRVRTMTVHVWNNYYDGCAKYGVGATMGSSVFVESNFFRTTKDPMLISKQGTDAKGDGTFSGENGGMIKSFGNVYAEKGASSNYTAITHKKSATGFDCYEAAQRDEQVPNTYKTLVGGTTYNNFDTDATLMYSYTPSAAIDVPALVTGYWGAGRLDKGDFKWTFDNATEDTDYNVNTKLKEAVSGYTSTLVGWF